MDDDLHDRGLAYDLASMRARARALPVGRRHALKVLAGAGAGIVLAACSSDSKTSSDATTSSTSTTAGSSSTIASGTSVSAVPQETEGPYPGDGSNGPNVLAEEGVVRQDIGSSFAGLSGTAAGIPLNVALQVVDASSGDPRAGAAVYIWHCTADGGYSLYSSGLTEQNYLRGVQAAGADGNLSFTSVYPGCYDGRWPHIHFEVYEDVDAATSGGRPIVTSQIAMPQGASREAYLTDAYGNSLDNLGRTSLDRDMVFSDGYDSQLATVDGDPTAGYTASLRIGV